MLTYASGARRGFSSLLLALVKVWREFAIFSLILMYFWQDFLNSGVILTKSLAWWQKILKELGVFSAQLYKLAPPRRFLNPNISANMSRREKLHQIQNFANLYQNYVSKFGTDQTNRIHDTVYLVEATFSQFF